MFTLRGQSEHMTLGEGQVRSRMNQKGHLNPQLTGGWGGGLFFAPLPPVFLRYLLKLRTDHRQIFNTLHIINFTCPDKWKIC